MRRIVLLFLLGFMLSGGFLRAQIPMPLTNGSFEQWTSHPGYSVSVIGFTLPVYDTFSTPSVWDYMSYPVNQAVSFYGFTINVNTSVPLVKATRATGQVPDGSTAVQLQTFMLEDIIDPTMLSLASGSIDPSLVQMVIPSVLSTGVINIDAFIPIITNMLSGTTSVESMLSSLDTMDVNDYIAGGVAMGDFEPARLTGYYKYHSATGGDNGGVVLLGTHYNNITHQRDIVGGGINLALTDTNEYTSFVVEYVPLSDIQPGSVALAPDSLIVLILSSASNNRQQGSMLSVDSLMLWQDTASMECAEVLGLTVVNQTSEGFPEMALSWGGSSQPDHWEVEYGRQGFEHGDGTIVETSVPYFDIYPLEQNNVLIANTWYDFYVRSVCADAIYGEWDSVHYRTFCASVGSLAVIDDNLSVTADNNISGYSISWVDSTDTENWLLTYGEYATGFPDGWGVTVNVDTPYFELPPLMPERQYAVAVSAQCGEGNYGMEKWVSFTTVAPAGISTLDALTLTVAPNPANGQCEVKLSEGQHVVLKLYSLDGRLMQTICSDGRPVVLKLPSQGIFLLNAITDAGTAIHKIVNR